MKTKDRIIQEALRLFAERGYDGVTVKEIASAVDIKDSSLYKHFTSKKEIFTTILEEMVRRIDELSEEYHLPNANQQDVSSVYGMMSTKELVVLTQKTFLFYWKDEFASAFRRMLVMEQYKNSEAYEIYRKFYLVQSIDYIKVIFSQMIANGYMIEGDPELMAINYYTPFFFLLARYDCHPEMEEEALSYVERYVKEFIRIYTKTN